MKTRNEIAKEIAEFVMITLKGAGIESLCVGGLPRDISLGGRVSDIDIVVSHEIDGMQIIEKIANAIESKTIPNTSGIDNQELFAEYGEDLLISDDDGEDFSPDNDFSERIEWVYRFIPNFANVYEDDDEECAYLDLMDDFKIDIIAAKCSRNNEDLLKFLDTFDFNLNRIAMDHTGFISNYRGVDEPVRPLPAFRSRHRLNARYKHLKRKYPNHPLVDWSELEASGKVNVLIIE